MVLKKWQKQIESAAYDLTHMEINTIIASEMTAAKTPSRPREMLHKIAGKYDEKLTQLLEEYNLLTGESSQIEKEALVGVIRQSGYYSYKEIQQRADLIENAIRKKAQFVDKTEDEIDSDLAILHRIRRNAQEIKDILNETDSAISINSNDVVIEHKKADIQGFVKGAINKEPKQFERPEWTISQSLLAVLKANESLSKTEKKHITKGDIAYAIGESRNQTVRNSTGRGDLDLDLRQLSILKKAFDIGTSKVVMQTIIGLDGDVTTRIAKSFADNPNALVNELHHDGIRISVDFWKTLINALKEFGQTIIKTFKS